MNANGHQDSALSQRLRQAAHALGTEPVALRHLADAHGPAGLGSLMILLAAPCMLPVPGVGTVLGMGLLGLALALWRGQDGPALPAAAGRFMMPAAWARRVLLLLASVHGLAARLARARWAYWANWADAAQQRRLAAGVGCMAVLIVLPIPMGNLLPAVALVLLGLGLVFRDGLAMLLAAMTGVLALAFTAALGWLAWAWGLAPVLQWLGAWLPAGQSGWFSGLPG